MRKNTKKKILSLTLVIALLSIAVVGGTLAWFTAEDEATNTFTVGYVEITQNEKDETGADFEQNQPLLPVVNQDPASDDNYIHKIVTVTNTGKNDAYIRTHIAVPTNLLGYLVLDTKLDNWKHSDTTITEVEGIDYTVYSFDYNSAIAPAADGREAETTDVLLKGVYLTADTDVQLNETSGKREFCKKNAQGEFEFSGFAVEDATNVHVLVATQAVQVEGFTDAATALNTAFGTIPTFAIPNP